MCMWERERDEDLEDEKKIPRSENNTGNWPIWQLGSMGTFILY